MTGVRGICTRRRAPGYNYYRRIAAPAQPEAAGTPSRTSVTGPCFFKNLTAPLPAGNETIEMQQDAIGIAHAW